MNLFVSRKKKERKKGKINKNINIINENCISLGGVKKVNQMK